MVDVRVGTFKSPLLRIGRKIRSHVFMNFFLQVDTGFAKCSDHYISTRPGIRGHVSAGIRYDSIVLCVMRRYLDLFVTTFDDVPNRLRGNAVRRRPLERLSWPGRTEWMRKRIARAADKADRQKDRCQNLSHSWGALPPLLLER